MARIFSILAMSLVALPAFAEDAKLDLILEELQALRAQVKELEERIDAMEKTPSAPVAAPKTRAEKEKWYEAMRIELKKAETRASGPWVNPKQWELVKVGMKKEEVESILGEATRFKFSVKKKTDEILIWEGDLNGDGNLIRGDIRIYKGKVTDIEKPQF